MGLGVVEYSAGNGEQTNVSWMNRDPAERHVREVLGQDARVGEYARRGRVVGAARRGERAVRVGRACARRGGEDVRVRLALDDDHGGERRRRVEVGRALGRGDAGVARLEGVAPVLDHLRREARVGQHRVDVGGVERGLLGRGSSPPRAPGSAPASADRRRASGSRCEGPRRSRGCGFEHRSAARACVRAGSAAAGRRTPVPVAPVRSRRPCRRRSRSSEASRPAGTGAAPLVGSPPVYPSAAGGPESVVPFPQPAAASATARAVRVVRRMVCFLS